MGQVTITLEGSFGAEQIQYTATEGGHAYALIRAIHWLIARSPKAIQLDHQLHDSGDRPPGSDFGRAKLIDQDI